METDWLAKIADVLKSEYTDEERKEIAKLIVEKENKTE